MNILIISYYFPPSSAIGAKRVLSIYNSLVDNGHSVKVITSNNIPLQNKVVSNKKSVLKKIKGIISIDLTFRSIDKTLFSNFFISSIKKIIKLKDQEVIIVSYKPSSVIYLGIFAKLLFKAKLVIDLRDLISQIGVKKKYLVIHQIDVILDKIIMSFADEIITVSEVCKLKSEKLYKKNVTEVQNGIDGDILDYQATNNDILKILYAGTLSNERTLENTLKFLENYNYELIVASSTKPKEVNKNINWIGYVSKNELDEIIQKTDVFLLLEGMSVNSFENIPAKVFEYLKYNKPILIDCNPKSQISTIVTSLNKGINIHSDNIDLNKFIKDYNTSKILKKCSREYQNNKLLNLIENFKS